MLLVYCITRERHWLSHLQESFPGIRLESIPTIAARSTIPAASGQKLDVLIADFDSVSGAVEQQAFFVSSALHSVPYVIAIVPKRLAPLGQLLGNKGVHVLHKPVTAGEITIAMNRAVRKLRSEK